VTNHSAQRAVRMAILSWVFALVALSFLAVGIASAQTVNPAPAAQSGILQGNNTTVSIVANQQGIAAYSPNQITVGVNQVLRIVNKTTAAQAISSKSFVSFMIAPGTSRLLSFNQTGQFQLTLASTHATLTVNVVPFRG
jgi:hypothetical protein